MLPPLLLAVPNVSEGRDAAAIEAIGRAFAGAADAELTRGERGGGSSAATDAALLDTHSDLDHDRSVYTLAAPVGAIADALLRGAAAAVASVDVMREVGLGQHPHVGALDVAPIV